MDLGSDRVCARANVATERSYRRRRRFVGSDRGRREPLRFETVARPYTHNLIQEHALNAEVISVGSSELVQIAEHKLRGGQITAAQLQPILQPFFDHPRINEMDVLVLACTHFPLLRTELAAQFAAKVQLIDSGEAIARRVLSLLSEHAGKETTSEKHPEHRAVFTKASAAVEALQPQLAQFGIHNLDIIDV